MKTDMEFKIKSVMADLEINGQQNTITMLEGIKSQEDATIRLNEAKRFLAELQEDFTPEMAVAAREVLLHRVNGTLGTYLGE